MENDALARIETALAEVRADFEARFDGIDARFDSLESTVVGMRADMERRFDDVERGVVKLEVAVADTRLELRDEIAAARSTISRRRPRH